MEIATWFTLFFVFAAIDLTYFNTFYCHVYGDYSKKTKETNR